MNIVSKVTWEYMKKNRTRTIVTVIGVILSAAMFTAVTTLLASTYYFGKQYMIESNGNYHTRTVEISGEKVNEFKDDKRLKNIYAAEIMGLSTLNSKNSGKPYICVFGVEKSFFDNICVDIITGRLPENNSEILIPAHYLDYTDEQPAVGDKIILNLGKRMSDGYELSEYNPYDDGEYIDNAQALEYTVVGIYARPAFEAYSNPAFSALTLGDGIKSGGIYNVFLEFSHPSADLNNFFDDYDLADNKELNKSVLAFSGMFQYNNQMSAVTGFAVILILIIFIGSVSLIYSAFSISISERTKQFGLLSSVGATNRQVKRSVFSEAALISVMGVPIGIVSGVAGIGILLNIFDDFFKSWLSSSNGIKMIVTPVTVICSCLISVITVFVSALIPAVRASKISAINAIRQNNDIKIKRHGREKTMPKLFIKLFGAEAMLSEKYFKRSRKKYMNTIISLAISVILFVSAGCFTSSLVESVTTTSGRRNYDIRLVFDNIPEDTAKIYKTVSNTEGVDCCNISTSEEYSYIMKADDLTEKSFEYYHLAYEKDFNSFINNLSVLYLDDSSFNEILQKNNEDITEYYDKSAVKCICLNSYSQVYYKVIDSKEVQRLTYNFEMLKNSVQSVTVLKPYEELDGYVMFVLTQGGKNADDGNYSWYFLPEEVCDSGEYTVDDYSRPSGAHTVPCEYNIYNIGLKISEVPLGADKQNELLLIRPLSMLDNSDNSRLSVYIKCADYSAVEQRIVDLVADGKIPLCSVFNAAKAEANERMIVSVVKVFSFGFIILISLISAANVFNIISTNINLRRRDYAMLKSIGMSNKGLTRMMNYECIIYGLNALLIGVPISIALSVVIYKVSDNLVDGMYTLPWQYLLIASICVFTVVFASMLYSMSKIKEDNEIDALKNENT